MIRWYRNQATFVNLCIHWCFFAFGFYRLMSVTFFNLIIYHVKLFLHGIRLFCGWTSWIHDDTTDAKSVMMYELVSCSFWWFVLYSKSDLKLSWRNSNWWHQFGMTLPISHTQYGNIFITFIDFEYFHGFISNRIFYLLFE